MLEEDYLMRLLLQFFKAMVRASEVKEKDKDPDTAADLLEAAIGNATEIDGAVLLSLAPESIAQVMQVSGVDPNVTEFVARSLLLEASYLRDAMRLKLADVREAQARAIAAAYGFELPEGTGFQEITEGLEEAAAQGGFRDQAGVYREAMGEEAFLDELLSSSGVSFGEEVGEDPGSFKAYPGARPEGGRFGAFIDG